MTPPPPGTIVRSHAELFAVWHGLMGGGGFSCASLWHLFLDADDRLLPVLVPIDDLPAEPDLTMLRTLKAIVGDLVGNGYAASVAMLLSRPGPSSMCEQDRRWARGVRATFGNDLPVWPVHLATRGRLQVFAADDLVCAS